MPTPAAPTIPLCILCSTHCNEAEISILCWVKHDSRMLRSWAAFGAHAKSDSCEGQCIALQALGSAYLHPGIVVFRHSASGLNYMLAVMHHGMQGALVAMRAVPSTEDAWSCLPGHHMLDHSLLQFIPSRLSLQLHQHRQKALPASPDPSPLQPNASYLQQSTWVDSAKLFIAESAPPSFFLHSSGHLQHSAHQYLQAACSCGYSCEQCMSA